MHQRYTMIDFTGGPDERSLARALGLAIDVIENIVAFSTLFAITGAVIALAVLA